MKKLFLLTFMFIFAFNAVSFAAVSGSKSKTSGSSYKPSTSTTQTAPSTQTTPSKSSTTEYKPSAPAQSYSDKAPAAATKPNTQTPQQSTGSSFLRSAGLFAGGMFLGSMLGNMFGFGHSGMFADIVGMLFNVVLLAGIVMAGRFLWDKFKNRDSKNR